MKNGIEIPLSHFGPRKPQDKQKGLHNYNLTPQEISIIGAIVDRLHSMLIERDPIRAHTQFDALTVAMDIATIHCNDRRLKLSQLLMCDASDFRADMIKIHTHLNRTTGKLPNEIRLIFEENVI